MTDKHWTPEQEINRKTVTIGSWSIREILEYGLSELLEIYEAFRKSLEKCEEAVAVMVERTRSGGRIITIGAGGSGVAGMSVMRELPQNHEAVSPEQFTYRIAGGAEFLKPLGCEELEDSLEAGRNDVDELRVAESDVIICISATGRTPYTRGVAQRAKELGAFTIALLCQPDTELEDEVDLPIVLDVGPEVFVGATCEKAATIQKHALDKIMDAVMVKLGITDNNECRARLCHEKARLRREFVTTRYRQIMANRF